MGVDSQALRKLLLALAKEQNIDALACVAIDGTGAGIVFLHNDNSEHKFEALSELAANLRECAERVDGLAEGALADAIAALEPDDDQSPSSAN